MFEIVEGFLRDYGYVVLFIGTFLEGETMVLVAGYLAKAGVLDLNWVILSSFAGTYLGDQTAFFIGRRWGHLLVKRTNSESWKQRTERVMYLLDRYNTWFIMGFRFIYGVRNVTPFALGASPIPAIRFMALNFVAAFVWATSFGYGGYIFGHAMEGFLDQIKHYQIYFFGGLGLLLIGIWVRKRFFKRAAAPAVLPGATELERAENSLP
ncbi:MAG: DedA family protein [Magnetococcales bacterium]|nr:DedA family protein [Magnetococcales bacterium]MBF0262617.1 DedA family protein [Magnetococcales bacterium]MBF0262754.1 DedA family protein [Magnetococcales bacterium]